MIPTKAHPDCRGTVKTLWPFVFGRFVAGIGGAGMTDLLSVLINGKRRFASFKMEHAAHVDY